MVVEEEEGSRKKVVGTPLEVEGVSEQEPVTEWWLVDVPGRTVSPWAILFWQLVRQLVERSVDLISLKRAETLTPPLTE